MCNGKRNCLNSDDETECLQLMIADQNKDPSNQKKIIIFTATLFQNVKIFYNFKNGRQTRKMNICIRLLLFQ